MTIPELNIKLISYICILQKSNNSKKLDIMELAVNDTNFDDVVLKSDKPVMVDFWAEWCGPCRMIAPAVEEISKEYEGRVVVVKCDVDDSPGVSSRFGIRNIPTVLFFKDGKVADKQVGAVPKSNFITKINNLL
jgi:thioredoxin 1